VGISDLLVDHMIDVFFFYGLAFYTLGVALVMVGRQSSQLLFARAIWPLAFFGFLHGAHEWFEMFQLIHWSETGQPPGALDELVRLVLLVTSFVALLAFGAALLAPENLSWKRRYLPVWVALGIWALAVVVVLMVLPTASPNPIAIADVLARYFLGIPGAVLGTWALMSQQRAFRRLDMPQFGRDLVWCAAALLLYGAIGQVFVRQTSLPPSTVLNAPLFLAWFGIPVQLFRAVMAAMLTVFMVRALRAFDLENRRQLQQANETRLAAQTRALEAERRVVEETGRLNEELVQSAHELERLYAQAQVREQQLGELLHQVVSAQEAERQRIARELHDATGQALTAIALGLHGTEKLAAHGVPISADQVREIESFATNALGELRQIIADLRPPQIDDLGLVAALRWYVQAYQQRRGIPTELIVQGDAGQLPAEHRAEYEIVIFRIVQEALTNIAKHAAANHAVVKLQLSPTEICVTIEDDGRGFDPTPFLQREGPQAGWGLLGIRERALLLGGECKLATAPGQGTLISVCAPIKRDSIHVGPRAQTHPARAG
jgi:signal transduction histidine kinase